MRDLTNSESIPAVLVAIDEANAADPNRLHGRPLALVQGERATAWLAQLTNVPSPELQLCVRAHHLRRWEVVRSDYPAGRQGYLNWRRANKAHQGESLASIMKQAGWGADTIERARTLLLRTKLRTDKDTQMLEDAACLVFLETQFEAMVASTDHNHLVKIVTKTLHKMSNEAIDLAGSVALSEDASTVLAEAATKS